MVRTACAVVLTLTLFEVGARALEPALPQTTSWREPMVAAKVARMDELSKLGPTDLVLAGTSQMLFAGDPTMLRERLHAPWSVYNAAIWGAPPVVNEHWLTKVVAPRLRPRAVVLGVSPVDFVDAATDDAVERYFASMSVRGDVLATAERTIARASVFVRERRSLRDPTTLAESIGRRIEGRPGPSLAGARVDDAGRAPAHDAATFDDGPLARKMVAGLVSKGWTVSERQRSAFRRTIAKLRGMGAEVIVADMAISGPLVRMLGPQAYAKFHAFLREEASTLGVPVLDTARGLTSTTFFFDFDHVNRSGADVFNTVLWRALGKGSPGRFTRTIAPDVTTKPLAPTLASDVIAREETRAATRAAVPTPAAAAPTPPANEPDVRKPATGGATVPTPPAVEKPTVRAPAP